MVPYRHSSLLAATATRNARATAAESRGGGVEDGPVTHSAFRTAGDRAASNTSHSHSRHSSSSPAAAAWRVAKKTKDAQSESPFSGLDLRSTGGEPGAGRFGDLDTDGRRVFEEPALSWAKKRNPAPLPPPTALGLLGPACGAGRHPSSPCPSA
jgi:hypothetical protein